MSEITLQKPLSKYIDHTLLKPESTSADVAALLAEILPTDCLGQPAMELSGGMRRRVSLARAVAFPSDLIVLDEPFTGLDQATKEKVIAFVLRETGTPGVFLFISAAMLAAGLLVGLLGPRTRDVALEKIAG